MTLLEYLTALANKLNQVQVQPGMTTEQQAAFDALVKRVEVLEQNTAPLTGEINGLPPLN